MQRAALLSCWLLCACGDSAAGGPDAGGADARPAVCGDGVATGLEDCDGLDLRGLTCADFDFNSGQLTCHAACIVDLRGCVTAELCDNGVDDDGDVLVDCSDPGCANSVACQRCGDGVITGDEQCEDGNPGAGDCCDQCHAEAGCETEPNDTVARAQVLSVAAGGSVVVKGFIWPDGDLDVFAIAIPDRSTGKITAEVVGGAFNSDCFRDLDSAIDVLDASGEIAARDDDSGPGTCSAVGAAGLGPGYAYVRIDASAVGAPVPTFDYKLQLHLTLAPCGDGIAQEGQDCDDGNTLSGDGCSSACKVEAIAETEPNNTPATASGPYQPPFVIAGEIGMAGAGNLDSDWYAIDLVAPIDLRIETFDAISPALCGAISADVSLFDTTLGLVAVGSAGDDTDYCSRLVTPAGPLLPGRYFLLVESRPAPGSYRLVVTSVSP